MHRVHCCIFHPHRARIYSIRPNRAVSYPSACRELVDNQSQNHSVRDQCASFHQVLGFDACIALDMSLQHSWQQLPRGVRSLTFFLSKSPELMEERSVNFFIKRSVCVPLPTPGAPTRIRRAALESCGKAMLGKWEVDYECGRLSLDKNAQETVEWKATSSVWWVLSPIHCGCDDVKRTIDDVGSLYLDTERRNKDPARSQILRKSRTM